MTENEVKTPGWPGWWWDPDYEWQTMRQDEEMTLYVASCSPRDPDYEGKKQLAELQGIKRRSMDKRMIRFAVEEAMSRGEFRVTMKESLVDELYQKWMNSPQT